VSLFDANRLARRLLAGVVPALLILWVRVGMAEPESWRAARVRGAARDTTSSSAVERTVTAGVLRRHTLLATALAAIGLATFWGAHFRARTCCGRRWNKDGVVDNGVLDQYEMLGISGRPTGAAWVVVVRAAESAVLGGAGICAVPLGAAFAPGGVGGAAGAIGGGTAGVVAQCLASSRWGCTRATPFTFRSCFRRGCAAPGPALLHVARCVVIPVLLLFALLQRFCGQDLAVPPRGAGGPWAMAGGLAGGLFLVGRCYCCGVPRRAATVAGIICGVRFQRARVGYVSTCRASRRARWKRTPRMDNQLLSWGCNHDREIASAAGRVGPGVGRAGRRASGQVASKPRRPTIDFLVGDELVGPLSHWAERGQAVFLAADGPGRRHRHAGLADGRGQPGETKDHPHQKSAGSATAT